MEEFWLWLLAGAVGWYLWAALTARDRAVQVARAVCKRNDVQLLDETVVQMRVRPKRNARGQMSWQRSYRFEVSVEGDERRTGSITLLGLKLISVELELDGGALHEDVQDL